MEKIVRTDTVANLWNPNRGRIYGPEQEQMIVDVVKNNRILTAAEIANDQNLNHLCFLDIQLIEF